ncbi:hypothetical protein M9H77_36963 [Catharanthus roseus]|uniref:Uncharacterized protein n=1 Tax=Catharanthus roseus TaxID=4058 RepID=A0ACB9ZTN2_CATRO|nr:hypothetical protein M9H77_36963 [Catharanthus roseus]
METSYYAQHAFNHRSKPFHGIPVTGCITFSSSFTYDGNVHNCMEHARKIKTPITTSSISEIFIDGALNFCLFDIELNYIFSVVRLSLTYSFTLQQI